MAVDKHMIGWIFEKGDSVTGEPFGLSKFSMTLVLYHPFFENVNISLLVRENARLEPLEGGICSVIVNRLE